ncbi:MAG TPA: DUF512 domain-containing protein [Syntrophomonadaceae bacterium]|nr:DUF512 domain-containing protein [Syntrophomonadaceae bacterium]HRX21016.1 DUF512 domain-containing protein [Syntrophomonadaceae bacterium]
MHPCVQSIGIVPVGLTGHRNKLADLRVFDLKEIQDIITLIDGYQTRFRKELGYGLVYLADEFYLAAGQPVPGDEYYDDYSQIENGIGLSRILLDDFSALEAQLPTEVPPRKVFLLTGESALPVMFTISRRLNAIAGLTVEVLPVKNSFFGGNVSVTGLLTGSDIIDCLGINYKGENIIIPEVVFRDGNDVLLDDVSIAEIAGITGANFQIVDGSAQSLVDAILEGA